MQGTARFEFTTVPPRAADVTIDETTKGEQALFSRLAEGLSFPDYFGRNWDALLDCLRDRSWSHERELIVDHASLPVLGLDEMRIYLEILSDAVGHKTADTISRLRVVFRVKDRETVLNVLSANSN